MDDVQAFDGAQIELSPNDERDTMADPRSEGRGLVTGIVLALIFWTSVAAFVWWLVTP